MKKGRQNKQINVKLTETDLKRLMEISEKYEITMSNCVRHLVKKEYESLMLSAKADILKG